MIKMRNFRSIAILALSFFLFTCSNTKDRVAGPSVDQTGLKFMSIQSACGGRLISTTAGPATESSQSACKAGFYKGAADASGSQAQDSVLAWFNADTVWVMHKNAFENCCSAILSDVFQTPQGFDVFERDTSTGLCRCMCYFDLVTTICDVPSGVHVIRVFDIRGDFVGQTELNIPSTGDTVIFSAHGDTIFVTHQDAFYNCCSEIVVDAMPTAEGFDLFERDTSEELCYCMCDFDISTVVSGVAEGEYLVRLFDIYGDLVGSALVTIYGYVI
jgi:hypothetical protein